MSAQNQIHLIATHADKNVAKPAAFWDIPTHIEAEIEAQRSIRLVNGITSMFQRAGCMSTSASGLLS